MPDSPSVSQIVQRLRALRARIRGIFAVVGIARLGSVVLGSLGLFFLADWLLDLPLGVRQFVRLGLLDQPKWLSALPWLLCLALCGFFAYVFTRAHRGIAGLFAFLTAGIVGIWIWYAIRALAPLRVRLSDEEMAMTVEEHYRHLNDRLAASLDFERELRAPSRGESPAMMRAVVADAVKAAEGLSMHDAASGKRAALWAGGLMGVACVAFILVAVMPATIGLWWERSIELRNTPWPRATTMSAVSIDAAGNVLDWDPAKPYTVALGRPLTIHARAIGKVPNEAFLVDLIDGQQPLARRMFAVPEIEGVFAFEFRDVRRPFAFVLKGGDDEDEEPLYRVEITIPPHVLSIESTITYPAYLGGTSETFAHGNVTAPEGSQVAVAFTTSMDVAEAKLVIGEDVRPVQSGTPRSFTFEFEADATLTYRLALKTPDGKSNDPAADTYEVRVRRDQAPSVEWVFPRQTMEVTADGRLPLLVRARDDHAITHLALEARIASDEIVRFPLIEFGTEPSVDLTDAERANVTAGTDGPYGRTQVLTYVPLDLSKLRTPEGDPLLPPARMAFRLVAQDSREQTREGEWNYVDVFGAAELARGLSGRRSNARSEVGRVYTEQTIRRDELKEVMNGPVGPAELSLLKEIRFTQGKLAQDADRATRGLIEIFNSFIYNRLGARKPTNEILFLLDRHHRATYGVLPAGDAATLPPGVGSARAWQGDPAFPYALYEEIIAMRKDKVDKGLITRLIAVIDDAVRVGAYLAPEAHRAATRAVSGTKEDLQAALDAQNAHLAALDRLLDSMRRWKSLSDVTAFLHRLIQEQKSLGASIEGDPNEPDDK